jgi:hypothetical protein
VDSGLARALVGAMLVAGLALAAHEAPAQLTDLPPSPPPPVDTASPAAAPVNGPGALVAPPAAENAPAVNTPDEAANTPDAPPPPAVVKPPPPLPGPPLPMRTPTAIMQVLDKVTAETLQFEAPVGRPIRYKTLVMTVRVL